MSKIAAYLQEHILGEVSTNAAVLKSLSHDGSVLEIMPEMVVYPRVTNDIRKVARFAWQLAEKGHVLPLTARGNGGDQTGAAIGKGVIISLPAHMNRIFEFDAKQRLVRVQPGANAQALNDALGLHGVAIPSLPGSSVHNTIGGAVSNNASGPLTGRYGLTENWVHQLEVVLANGDILQTQRLSRRELSKKKGSQGLEAEIYREIDNLIEDNKELIDKKIGGEIHDNVGYSGIADVKRKDGSFDLTPLIVGSQGTLGIISEMIMKGEFLSTHQGVAAIAFKSHETARDTLDQLEKLEPAFLEYYRGDLFELAATSGKQYDFLKNAAVVPEVVVLIGFDDFSDRARRRKLKKLAKLLKDTDATLKSLNGEDDDEILAMRDVVSYLLSPQGKDVSAPTLFDGVYIPRERFEEFSLAAAELAVKHHVVLPLYGRILENIWCTRPQLHLHKIGDKQKIFKLLEEYGDLVERFGGHLIGNDGEGRVKARFAYAHLDDDVLQLFAAIKKIFDPYEILNPGVKQPSDIRELVSMLRSSYDTVSHPEYLPRS